ncbi:MAG: hypothetical protein IPM59_04640 [Chloracidobacterium sp.]|nr:hypothetical protein [Chloracidobacterium sp.]
MSKSYKRWLPCAAAAALLAVIPLGLSAQTKRPKKPKKAPAPTAKATPSPIPEPTPAAIPPKRNERPSDGHSAVRPAEQFVPVYLYKFERPGFVYEVIEIELDDAGKGKIAFSKSGFDEPVSDPVQLSAVTLDNLKKAFTALNFLDSTEEYQIKGRDYSNMGNLTITMKKQGRERTVKYNWTENKDAKMLMDEYRRISNEYTWAFEITLARENQPLQTPGLMDTFASYYKRNELSDPPHLLPLLTELSTDERMPLMARNRAAKLIEQIQKAKK